MARLPGHAPDLNTAHILTDHHALEPLPHLGKHLSGMETDGKLEIDQILDLELAVEIVIDHPSRKSGKD